MESFWGSMQIELLNRQKWRTKMELGLAMADYIEHFYNSDRRHSSLGYLTPNESRICTQLPASRPFCPKKWSTQWGQPHHAEEVGFEPTVSFPTHDFQSCRFGRSRTPPELPVRSSREAIVCDASPGALCDGRVLRNGLP
jgi:Integrase core domain